MIEGPGPPSTSRVTVVDPSWSVAVMLQRRAVRVGRDPQDLVVVVGRRRAGQRLGEEDGDDVAVVAQHVGHARARVGEPAPRPLGQHAARHRIDARRAEHGRVGDGHVLPRRIRAQHHGHCDRDDCHCCGGRDARTGPSATTPRVAGGGEVSGRRRRYGDVVGRCAQQLGHLTFVDHDFSSCVRATRSPSDSSSESAAIARDARLLTVPGAIPRTVAIWASVRSAK